METLNTWQRSTLTPSLVKPIPWMHPAAVCYLESLLRPDWHVLEHGSGGSTLWLAERVAHVTSVEDRMEWYQYIAHHNERGNIDMYYSPDGCKIPHIEKVDLLLIDGHPAEARAHWLLYARRITKPGGVVVLDNSNETYSLTPRWDLERWSSHAVTIHPHSTQRALDTTFYFMKGNHD